MNLKNILPVAHIVLVIAALLTALALADGTAAQAPNYTLDWWTADGGGGVLTGAGGYTLHSTAGQADAAFWQDGVYTLTGGFWGGGAAGTYCLYLPLLLRMYGK